MEKFLVWSPGIGTAQLKLQKYPWKRLKMGGGVTENQISVGWQ